MAVKVYYQKERFRLRESGLLKKLISEIIREEGYKCELIEYIFTDDELILQLNKEFLEHDYYTDVITFDRSFLKNSVIAEIYISVDTVKRNAKENGVPFRREVLRVMIHGILHVTGYNDNDESSRRKMREKEDHYLRKYFDGISI